MNQKGFINIILIIGLVILVGIAGYFIGNQRTSSPTPIPVPQPTPPKSTTDTFAPKINDLTARGVGRIVKCQGKNVQYFYWGSGTALPASVMRKEGTQPWEARPGILNPDTGSPLKEEAAEDLAVNPKSCDELYVVTERAEVYKSKTGGKTWEKIEPAPAMTSFSSGTWGIVLINPKDVRHVVVGAAFRVHSELIEYRLFQSRDSGQSFLPVELEHDFTQPPTRTEISNLLF